ncbi:MAG: serine hydroxymethyltransferase [Patescibacteria group bacterium]|nr:serine hydroxymethyltransferase [Patescibacteria group bacterium]
MQYNFLGQKDPQMAELIKLEQERQRDGLALIPSENYVSPSVMEALGSSLTNKYAEGYPGKRYYSGNVAVDKVENLVRDRAKALFGVPYANVQPYSGSPANFAVYFALLEPGDTFMGLDLLHGGHLTHGWKFSATSKFWKSVPYGVLPDGQIDFEALEKSAREVKPKLIWCGGTALPRTIDFERFGKIADEVGAYLVADISHISGLVVGGAHPSPAPHVHLITTTTHKTLRGPRGAMIMVTEKGLAKDAELPEKIDKAIIPGLQGGPHLNAIASIGVALHEAAQPEFKDYSRRIVENARALADGLIKHGFKLVSGGTDNHLLLVDLTPEGNGRGVFLHEALEAARIYTNKNMIPGDPSTPFYPSGLRLGTPAVTTRAMGKDEMMLIADFMARVATKIKDVQLPGDKESRLALLKEFRASLKDTFYSDIAAEVKTLCDKFPIEV